LKQQGLGIVLPSYKPEGDVSNLEKWVNAPVLSNILGRYVKVTNYGRKEQLDEVKQNVVKEEAKARQEEKDKLKKYVKEYYKGSQSLTSKMEIRREFRLDVLGEPPWNKTKAKALDKKFNIAVVKGINDPEVTEVIYASSNAQKVALLVNIKNNHTEEEYRALKIMLFQEKIASKEVLKEVDSK